MRTVIATDHHRNFEFGDYLGLQLLAIAGALAVVAMIACASGYPVVSQVAILLLLWPSPLNWEQTYCMACCNAMIK